MSEHQWKILISAYADGELSPKDLAEAERLLKEVPEARHYLDSITSLSSSLRVIKDAAVSPDLDRKVLKPFLNKGESMKTSNIWKPSLAVATVCVAIIIGGLSLNQYAQRGMQGRLKSASDFLVASTPAQVAQQVTAVAAMPSRAAQQLASVASGRVNSDKLAFAEKEAATTQYEPYYSNTLSKSTRSGFFSAERMHGVVLFDAAIDYKQYVQSAPGNTEEYNTIEEGRFLEAVREPLSTFSADVDTGSYTNIRRYLNGHQMPPKDAVRLEEMINYFGYDYPKAEGNDPFSITVKGALCPWNKDHKLVLIGLKGKTPDAEKLPPSNLVFLLDISGSMESPEKLPLIQQAFSMMVRQLRDKDKVAIVVYAGSEGVALDSTSGADKEKIIAAIQNLQAGGSTAGGAGIRKAYEIAKQNFIADGNNRVILATDGDFNVGVSSTSDMVSLIEEKRKEGVFLTVIGVGYDGNLKDGRLQQIADKGNGSYHYFDSLQEATKVFMSELGSTLFTIAKDVKIQVEFNPAVVKAYRLIGYEKRKLNNADFNDDKKDAGEIGAGHTVTAMYEIIPTGSNEQVSGVDALKYQEVKPAPAASTDEMLTVKLRYKEPKEDVSKLLSRVLKTTEITSDPQGDFAFATAVAEFGMVLRHSVHKGSANYAQVLQAAKASTGDDKFGYRAEFIKLVEIADSLDVSTPGGNLQFK